MLDVCLILPFGFLSIPCYGLIRNTSKQLEMIICLMKPVAQARGWLPAI